MHFLWKQDDEVGEDMFVYFSEEFLFSVIWNEVIVNWIVWFQIFGIIFRKKFIKYEKLLKFKFEAFQ